MIVCLLNLNTKLLQIVFHRWWELLRSGEAGNLLLNISVLLTGT